MRADLNGYLAVDPWKEDRRIPDLEQKIEVTTTKIKRQLNYIRHFIEDQQFTNLKAELGDFEWNWRFLRETEIEKTMRPSGIQTDMEAVINLTEVEIPEDTRMVVAWGKKFAFPTDIWDDVELITEVDSMIERKMSTLLWQEAKKRGSIMIDRQRKRRDRNDKKSWLNFIAQRATNFFDIHPQLIILQSDKGKHSVIMHRKEYERKIMELLCDEDTYTTVEINMDTIIQKNDDLVNELIESGAIKKEKRGRMSDKGTIPAKFYGLPKIHKEGEPLRPITSTINSPGRNLATLMVNILTPIFSNNELHIQNSITCKARLNSIKMDPEERLVSFDVVSMFTNISTELAIRIIKKKRSIIESHGGIPFELVERIMKFLLNECAFFTYGNKTYRQKNGLPMGSPTSPLIANIVMSDLMETQRSKFTRAPKFIYVYVDDTIGGIHKDHIVQTLATLNAYDNRINFTIEIENEGKINFLDMTLMRRGEKIATNWFKKPYASDRLLNYLSTHKHSTIINVAKAHIRTVLQLSDADFFNENRNHIMDRLRANNFPEMEIIRIMQEYTLMKAPTKSITRHTTYASMPFIRGLTHKIGAAINTLEPNITIAAKPIRKKGRIWSNVKNQTHNKDKINTIVKMTCECKKKTLIGSTNYKEKAGQAIKRIIGKNKAHIGTSKCTQHHEINPQYTEYLRGADTHKKTITKRDCIAFGMNEELVNNLPWPHEKWRKHLKGTHQKK